jgi:ADP-heptose:LPS heptosyltransferase
MKHGIFERFNLLDKILFKGVFNGLALLRPDLSFPYSIDGQAIRHILVIRPGGFGDMLLALPFLRQLKLTFPDATIDLVCMKRNVGLAKIMNEELNFARILLLEKDSLSFLKTKYDLAFSLDQSKYQYLVPVIMGLLSARIKVGYDIGRRARFCTHRVVYRHDEHEAQCSLNGLKFFGIDPRVTEENLGLSCLPECRDMTGPIVAQHGLESGKFVACSFGGLNPQNKLSAQTLRKLVERLCTGFGFQLVILGSDVDSADVESLMPGFDGRIVNLCGKTSLKETLGVLNHAGVFFGYDGGPLHMAVAAGCKTVSVWGPSLFDKWAPQFSDRHSFVRQNLACQPCLNGRFPIYQGCPFNRECLLRLDTDVIATKIYQALGHP